jgi:hypothetical protein
MELQLPPSHRVRILNLEITPKLCTRVYLGTTRKVVVVAETNHPFVNESQLREIAHTYLLYENEKLLNGMHLLNQIYEERKYDICSIIVLHRRTKTELTPYQVSKIHK